MSEAAATQTGKNKLKRVQFLAFVETFSKTREKRNVVVMAKTLLGWVMATGEG